MNENVNSRLNNKGREKTERDVSLSCAFYRSYFDFYIEVLLINKLIFKSFILLKFKFIRFQMCIQNKKLTLLVIRGLPLKLTVIDIINKRFY